MPKISPVEKALPKAKLIYQPRTIEGIRMLGSMAIPDPTSTPMTPPTAHRTTASSVNWLMMVRLIMPKAFARPSLAFVP